MATGSLIVRVYAGPQVDPNPNSSAVYHAARLPSGFVVQESYAEPQDITVYGSGFIKPAIRGNPNGVVTPTIWASAPQQVDLTIQGFIRPSAVTPQGAIVWQQIGHPQEDPTQIQPQEFKAAASPAGAIIWKQMGHPQEDPSFYPPQISKPLVAPPIVPGPVASFFTTLPQIEDRPTRIDYPPARAGSTPRPIPRISAAPQFIDSTAKAQVFPAVTRSQGRVPPYTSAAPQVDLTVRPQLFRELPILVQHEPIKALWASPQNVDLTIQGWIQGPAQTPQGAVPPALYAQPPQTDLTIQAQIWGTPLGPQGPVPAMINAAPPPFDYTIQPDLDPCLAIPVAALLYAYTLIEITAVAQLPFQLAGNSTFIENSACVVNAAYFSLAGTPLVPQTIQYQINDVLTGFTILDWTPIVPQATTSEVFVTAEQNAMISNTRMWENHQILFQIVDGSGNTYNAKKVFTIRRVPGFPGWTPPDCPE